MPAKAHEAPGASRARARAMAGSKHGGLWVMVVAAGGAVPRGWA